MVSTVAWSKHQCLLRFFFHSYKKKDKAILINTKWLETEVAMVFSSEM